MSIAPGTQIQVELTALPASDAAAKTLVRLFRKDIRVARHHRQQQSKRPSWEEWRRGNMTWHHQMKTQPAVQLKVGARYSFRATIDVLRDLNSVKRFVSVKPA